ncbi:MAG TPA: universal stress protein [Acidimicrobiales bacterium]|nr:universal stress protein [Acidimicrobiales bacterium]
MNEQEFGTGPPRRIVLGVDGSDVARRAAAFLAALAGPIGAEVIAVHAVGLLSVIDGEVHPSEQVQDRLAELVAGEWCRPLVEAGVPVRPVLEDGPPSLVLIRVAEREDADLVVVGSRGVNAIEGVLLGSTSHYIAQLSPVPVVIVPPRPRHGGHRAAAPPPP